MRLFLFIAIITCTTIISSCYSNSGTHLYIDATKVFDSFNLTIELKAETQNEEQRFSSSLDSLNLALSIQPEVDSEDYRRLAYGYQELERAGQNHMTKLIQESDDKIWKLLNQYFKEFGANKKCKMLFGGMGNGSVLYVDDSTDVTEEFIQFANKKYEGE